MCITETMHKFSYFQSCHLRNHVCQQRIRGDVKWHAEKNISAALIHLQTDFTISHKKLIHHMTGRKCHLTDKFRISSDDNISTRVRIIFYSINSVLELVNMSSILRRSSSSLLSIDRTKVPSLLCKRIIVCYFISEFLHCFSLVCIVLFIFIEWSFIPNTNIIFAKVLDIRTSLDKPDKFVH